MRLMPTMCGKFLMFQFKTGRGYTYEAWWDEWYPTREELDEFVTGMQWTASYEVVSNVYDRQVAGDPHREALVAQRVAARKGAAKRAIIAARRKRRGKFTVELQRIAQAKQRLAAVNRRLFSVRWKAEKAAVDRYYQEEIERAETGLTRRMCSCGHWQRGAGACEQCGKVHTVPGVAETSGRE
jgi:hypothetical protein